LFPKLTPLWIIFSHIDEETRFWAFFGCKLFAKHDFREWYPLRQITIFIYIKYRGSVMRIVSKICNILYTVILTAVILAGGGILVLRFLGFQPMAVLSGSMQPAYKVGDLVFVNTKAKPEDMRVDDVITFNVDENTIVTHRVIETDSAAGTFTTKGDANDNQDFMSVTYSMFVGKAVFSVPGAGRVLMNLDSRNGLAMGMMLVGVLAVLFIVPIILKPEPVKPKEEQQPGESAEIET
jgi:signal peptidase